MDWWVIRTWTANRNHVSHITDILRDIRLSRETRTIVFMTRFSFQLQLTAKVFAWLLGVNRSVKSDFFFFFQQWSLPDWWWKVQQRISFNTNLQTGAFIDGCKQREKSDVFWRIFFLLVLFIDFFFFLEGQEGVAVWQRSSLLHSTNRVPKTNTTLATHIQIKHDIAFPPIHTLEYSGSLSHDRNNTIRFLDTYLLIL